MAEQGVLPPVVRNLLMTGIGRLAPTEGGQRAVQQAILHTFATTGRAPQTVALRACREITCWRAPRLNCSVKSQNTLVISRRALSSALLGRCEQEGLMTRVACAGPDGKERLQLAKDRIEAQAGAAAFGSRRSKVQKAWARAARVTWRCQPAKLRPSKWSRPSPSLSSR
jgi:hypothetical protein